MFWSTLECRVKVLVSWVCGCGLCGLSKKVIRWKMCRNGTGTGSHAVSEI